MIIELTVQRVYTYEIEVFAEMLADGAVRFRAKLAAEGFLSHFDNHEEYLGGSIHEALGNIGKAIDHALKQMQEI